MDVNGRKLSVGVYGEEVRWLQQSLLQNGFQIPASEIERGFFGPGTRQAVLQFQRQRGWDITGEVDPRTREALSFVKPSDRISAVPTSELGPILPTSPATTESSTQKPIGSDQPESGLYIVDGTVGSPDRTGVSGLRIQLVDKNIGQDVPLAEGVTDERGRYTTRFVANAQSGPCKANLDLQARAYSGQTFLAASEIRYNATNRETLNILVPANCDALPSEYETLTRALATCYGGRLSDLRESDDHHDITYLANKTGWDARAVALAALADQFSQRAARAEIPPYFFYALFRAALPANEDTLYHTDAGTLEAVWKKAVEQCVIPKASADQISNLIGRFQALSAQKLLTGPALIGASPLKDMLAVCRLNDAQQERFAELYTTHRTDTAKFWDAVANSFGAATANRLQMDGKLAFLTINNAPLMQKVHATAGANGLSDPLQLAQTGYHRAEPWSRLLTDDVPIPKEIPGETQETKRTNYANYLGAQVRLSYPTAAVAQMVKSGELPLTGAAPGASDNVHAFLSEHQGKFEIGVQPVQQYIAQNNLHVAEETVKQVKRLQRVYQITPSDQAMTGLMKRGIDAAYHVVRYDKEIFVRSFADDLGGVDHAALTYDKSVQVHNAVLNIALSYLSARTAPAIGVHSPASVLDPTPASTEDVIACATLESLFGSMDFCACDHCRSILSPAAYLVDLLLFLHSDPDGWTAFLKTWKQDHANAPYPFIDQNAWQKFQSDWNSQHPGQPLPKTEISPFDVLTSRRPDIQHLPLTCENTNTALPYIDVVNETLEYYISNGLTLEKRSLDEYHGHDTNGVASEDLLASPQFVGDSAYTTLRNERFPAPLPFHQPLEKLRRYFNKLEVPLPLAMERLRKTDDLDRGTNPYGWRDILMEEIGLSRAEYEILTDSPNLVPLWRMYGFPNGTADGDVVAGLSNVKKFARWVGVTYEELVSVLKARFINPNSDLIPKLERLSVNFAMLAELTKNDAATDAKFDALLAALAVPPDPAEYGGNSNAPKNDYTPIRAWVKDNANYGRIMGLITLAIPASTWTASKAYAIGDCVLPKAPQAGSTLYYECTTAGTSAATEPKWPTTSGSPPFNDGTVAWTLRDAASCQSFDNLAFRYSDPARLTQDIGAVDFVRLLRFIRLWKKLGWTIEQTDAAICSLYRADLAPLQASDIDSVPKLNSGFQTLLSRLGIVSRVMKALNLTVKRDLLPLLACWSEIGTHGDTALYRQMFLNPALLRQDALFADNGYGEFLADITKKLADHAEALRSAFNLTGDEYDRIIAALGYDANTALTISNISVIFRRGWLARKLKLSVRELLLLIQLTSLDPFAVPDPTHPAILRLISLVQALKDRSFKSAAALYLIWNQDLSGKSAPNSPQVAAFARTLRLGFAAVETEFAVADDPDGAIAQTRMAKVYGADAASFFFGLLNDTLTVEVEFRDPDVTLAPGPGRQAIDNAAGKTDAGVPKIAYDDFRKRLSYLGVLSIETRDLIKLAAGVAAVAFNTAVDSLYKENQAVINPFFARYPELRAPYDAYVSDTSHSVSEERNILLKVILPELVKRRKRQQALQAVSAVANTDLVLTQTFLDPPVAPFPLHAVGHVDQAALNDLLALETPGLSVQFFANDTATGAIIPSPDITSKLDYAPLVGGVGNPLPANPTPAAAISGVWWGHLEAPESGFFNLRIEADAGANITLQLLDDKGKPVILARDPTDATLWRNAGSIELRAGTLYPIKLTVEKVHEILRVQWEWEPKGQGRAVIPARYLYPALPFEAFKETYIRFLKATSLAIGLGLTADELAYLATHADYRINAQGQIDSNGQGWLNALPNADNLHLQNPADAAVAKNSNSALLTPLRALLDFARIKAEISPSDESLLTVLKDPTTATQNTDSLLFSITRWNQTSLNDVIAQFGGNITGLGHPDLFRRVYDAFALIQKVGISAKALIQATTNEPTADTVRDFQAALRARYDPASWRDVVRPINDELRSLQRDALVAYILRQMRSHPKSAHIDTPDKLFEYFLMDVQMDPCMQTSRIRHALSSVQLFIERCLMNLEPRVSPAAINAKQWDWVKRYRVWEANRKVYLFPENWLEPELRDDKSLFFKEFENELLQSDINEDSATTALLNYLSKLEEVAKLEPCGIYHIPRAEHTGEINHVVARTAGAHRKYYYRRYEYGHWTPWEQIKLDIEDNPVIPVVWKDRLLLLWLRILKESPLNPPPKVNPPPIDQTKTEPQTNVNARVGNLTSSQLTKGMVSEVQTTMQPTDAVKATVKAVLCWSEYYNGKWQPTKTSDVNRPTELGKYDAPSGFDRSAIWLSTVEEGDGHYLRVSIDGNAYSTFLLYNTHSLPVREEDAPHEVKSMFIAPRSLDSHAHTLTIYYWSRAGDLQPGFGGKTLKPILLSNQIPAGTVETTHPLQDIWIAPFFYEDSRHVFCVTTMEQPVSINDYLNYGALVGPGVTQVAKIPSLVFRTDSTVRVKAKPWGDGGPIGPNAGVIDPALMQRFVTEDAYIRQGIGTTAVIMYGDRQIGPSGAIGTVRAGT